MDSQPKAKRAKKALPLMVYFKTKKQMDTVRRAAKRKELSLSRFLIDAGMKEANALLAERTA